MSLIRRVALDTNTYDAYLNGDRRFQGLLQRVEGVVLPFVVVAELRAGFAAGNKQHENEELLLQFMAKPNVTVLYPDEATTLQYAQLYRQLRQSGTMIPTNDLWIAALVTQHGCSLATRDKHFEALPQLMMV